ncbi:kinase-like protein [Gonapodya prolifera JEL478]|uniref:Kinase-like protein n=1 Tax=Gonapodya prolifera (strain JEL478) TaxID=1344416 RepID=A0A139ADE5_GONPJ|nr:kinase-like protein [Gonapodya prolifera JEL478]|eukprot:KXS14465.1 kinase-like protein [Gonapodya prolifera JEL478]
MSSQTVKKRTLMQGMFSEWLVDPEPFAKGGFSNVRRAVELRTGLKAVAKTSSLVVPDHLDQSKPSWFRLLMMRELCTLAYLSTAPHPCVVRVYDAVVSGDKLILFQEEVEGIELVDYVQLAPSEEARYIVYQLLSAIEHMHNARVFHRDLKLDNVIINPKTLSVTVIDFNLSGFAGAVGCQGECVGCMQYVSPQVVIGAAFREEWWETGWCDVWSVGVCAYTLLTGHFPFFSDAADALLLEHKALGSGEELLWPLYQPIPQTAKSFVRRVLDPIQGQALKPAILLRDPWFDEIRHDLATPASVGTPASAVLPWSLPPALPLVLQTPALYDPDHVVQEYAITEFLEVVWPAMGSGGCTHRVAAGPANCVRPAITQEDACRPPLEKKTDSGIDVSSTRTSSRYRWRTKPVQSPSPPPPSSTISQSRTSPPTRRGGRREDVGEFQTPTGRKGTAQQKQSRTPKRKSMSSEKCSQVKEKENSFFNVVAKKARKVLGLKEKA